MVLILVLKLLKTSPRTLRAITISSNEAFPARSPRPLIVHSTCLAPFTTASSELATPKPKSLWLCTDIIALPLVYSLIIRTISPISEGNLKPTVSGRLIVVAPASMTASLISFKNPISLRPASSQLNSTSSTNSRA